jgi:nucleoside-diphosphate-sugar epimerase
MLCGKIHGRKLNRDASAIQENNPMHVMVLGGTGFIGPHVVRRLAETGHDVTLFNRGRRSAQPDLPPGVHRIAGDRDHLSRYASEFRAYSPDVVLDMRPLSERDARAVSDAFTVIARRQVAISSMDVYRIYGRITGTEPGPPEPLPITEDSPLREKLYPYRGDTPRPDDADDKWMDDYDKIPVERTVMGNPEMPGTVLRLPMVYGPGTMRDFEYVRRMVDGRPAILLDERMAAWRAPRGYVEDVAHAIALAVTDERAAGGIYNVAEPEARTLQEWVEELGRAFGWEGRVVLVPPDLTPPSMDPGDAPNHQWVVSSDRIRAELGYAERTPRDVALRRTVEWQAEHLPEEIDPAQFDYEGDDRLLAQMDALGK